MRWLLILSICLLAACDALPRDVEETSERVAQGHVIRVGIAGPIGASGEGFLKALAAETHASVQRQSHSLEPLLVKLEKGELDVVVAPFEKATGWLDRVALTPPLDGSDVDDHPIAVRAAARNGENRWVIKLERLARRGAKS